MVCVEEVLAVVARGRRAIFQGGQQQIFRVLSRAFTHGRHQGIVNPKVVVFNVIAVDLNGQLPILVGDGVRMRRERMQDARAEPFAHAWELGHPAISVFAFGGRNLGGKLIPPGFCLLVAFAIDSAEATIERP